MSTTTWIVLGVIVVLVLWIIMIYNGLIAMRQRVGQSFAEVSPTPEPAALAIVVITIAALNGRRFHKAVRT